MTTKRKVPDVQLAVKALRIALRNVRDVPLVSLSIAVALKCLTGRVPRVLRRVTP